MNRLNDKGFAISTMLYGILTIIVLILILLLNIMRSSYNRKTIVTDEIKYNLNKCIAKQIALENCFKAYEVTSNSCNDEYNSYVSCIDPKSDVGGKSEEKQNSLSRLILDNSDSNNDLIVDSNRSTINSKRYVFIGNNPKNYVRIGNENGRIISLETDGTIKVMLSSSISNGPFDSVSTPITSGTKKWTDSTLYNAFKSKYNNMAYTDRLVKNRFYTGTINDSYSTAESLTSISSEYTEDNFGLLSLDDYLKASGNVMSTCDLTSQSYASIGTAMQNCSNNNWIKSSVNSGDCRWLVTAIGSSSILSFSNSGVGKKQVTSSCSANLIVFLNGQVTSNISADGSQSNPYVIN